MHRSLLSQTVPGNINSKSAGEHSNVLFAVESCVLLHAIIFPQLEMNREKRTAIKKLKRGMMDMRKIRDCK